MNKVVTGIITGIGLICILFWQDFTCLKVHNAEKKNKHRDKYLGECFELFGKNRQGKEGDNTHFPIK